MAAIPVLTAVPDARVEAQVLAALGGQPGVRVVRRCVELPDVLAAAGAGLARVAVLGAGLRHLDREAVVRLTGAGAAVVGVAVDEPEERRLRQLGIEHVHVVGGSGEPLAALVAATVSAPARPAAPLRVPAGVAAASASAATGAGGEHGDAGEDPGPEIGEAADGRVVAVWGPTGGPGRTTVAVNLADEIARAGRGALLVDADPYGGTVAAQLGLLDDASGLTAACRAANAGTLDVPALARVAVALPSGLRVLTGIPRGDRWPELRASALERVLDLARRLAAVVVVDCGFSLECDEELTFDVAGPRRNAATLTALAAADVVVAVGAADPVGLQRLVRGLGDLREVTPAEPVVVLNRVRATAVGGGEPAAELGQVLERFAGLRPDVLVPLDVAVVDAAAVRGRTLAEAAPDSEVRSALRLLAARVAGTPLPTQRRRSWRRRGQRAR